MTRRVFVALLLTTAPVLLVSCGSDVSDVNLFSTLYLEQVTAQITVTQTQGGANADVVASLSGLDLRPYTLRNDQSLAVNGQALLGPDKTSYYTGTVNATGDYQITVTEPSKYVKTTTVATAGSFDVTAPATGQIASLSGFTVTWSNPAADQTVELTLKQVMDGIETTRTFGPYDDSGTHTFAAADLASDFFHGTGMTLSLTITKIRQQTNIEGFKSGTVSTRLSTSVTLTPGP